MLRTLLIAVVGWLALAPCAHAQTTLLTGLEGHWSLDAASGGEPDSTANDNDLAETSGTIASSTLILGTCRDFELDDTEGLRIADNASLSVGNESWAVAAWVSAESLPASGGLIHCIIGKITTTQGYRLCLQNVATSVRFRWRCEATEVVAATVPSTATPYFLVGVHNAATDELLIYVNGVSDATPVSYSGGMTDTSEAFNVGAQGSLLTPSMPWDGLIDEAAAWRRALTPEEVAALWNAGAGLAFSEWGGGGDPPAFRPRAIVVGSLLRELNRWPVSVRDFPLVIAP